MRNDRGAERMLYGAFVRAGSNPQHVFQSAQHEFRRIAVPAQRVYIVRGSALELLRDPSLFEGPRDRNGKPLGVTAKALLKHLRCSQPSLNEQMEILLRLGLVESRRYGRWVLYTRDEERIRQLKQTIIDHLLPPAPSIGS